jgi:3-oxoacyl-[acyl-carrier-protein] synthase II
VTRSIAVSGVGLLSAHGAAASAHLAALSSGGGIPADTTRFAPHAVLPLAPVDFEARIPRRADRRQMERWQLMGVHAASRALEAAGLGDDEALRTLPVNVAVGGGGRELDVDVAVLRDLAACPDPDQALNHRLAKALRPSFLLGQLSNMLAGNIAIVLGVGGVSRTFLGEEQAGVEAVRDAMARIAAGQADAVLVGGVLDAERPDVLIALALDGRLHEGAAAGAFDAARRGLIPGSQAAFLVLEARGRAEARGAGALAILSRLEVAKPEDEGDGHAGNGLAPFLGSLQEPRRGRSILTSLAGNPADAARVRTRFPEARMRAVEDMVGNGIEAALPMQLALAALGVAAAGTGAVALLAHPYGAAAAFLEPAS